MNESFVLRQEQCPECKKKGKDNAQDNLSVYSDGHKYCYSCKYTSFPDGTDSFRNKSREEVHTNDLNTVFLPADCNISYPERALDWIRQYELTKNDLLNHNVMWSDSYQRLIFPIYANGVLLAWQGRSFSLNKTPLTHKTIPKWFGRGNLKDCFNILGKGNILILTEDVISALKVSKCGVMAMPLYGCVVGRERFKRLYSLYKDEVEVRIWLDYDKAKEAVREAKLGQLCGLSCNTIITKLDPKENSYSCIKEILNIS